MIALDFSPAPETPGAEIEWTHVDRHGEVHRRAGVVIGGAPSPSAYGHGKALWVVPVPDLVVDVYRGGVVVVKASARTVPVGRYSRPAAWVGKGEFFSDDLGPTGDLARSNARRTAVAP